MRICGRTDDSAEHISSLLKCFGVVFSAFLRAFLDVTVMLGMFPGALGCHFTEGKAGNGETSGVTVSVSWTGSDHSELALTVLQTQTQRECFMPSRGS